MALKRAVIVEDIRQIRDLVHIALNSFGIDDIAEAGNGEEALAALRDGGADIVIMDWKMEVMDGLECARRIRAGIDGINPRLPIVLLTSMGGKESEAAAYAAGVDHFMEKPFSLRSLNAGVAKVLGLAAAR
ncbi:response regulator [Magnetospirillum gryphiswaldense]|nr:response regulator [Magnetospirillum gryphiswaldense]